MAWQTVVGAGLTGAGLAGSLFGKKKKAPSIDVAGMRRLIGDYSQKQRDMIGQQFEQLQPLTQQYQQRAGELGAGIEQQYGDIAEQYRGGLGQVGQAEQQTMEQLLANRRTQAARDIPLMQQMQREQAAASGLMRTGAAGRMMQQPVQQFQQEQSDLYGDLAAQRMGSETQRQQRALEVQREMATSAAAQRLGIDKDSMNTLLQTGREDLIRKFADLRGVSTAELNGMLQAMGLQTQVDLANTAAENERRQALWSALSGLGGQFMGYGMMKK